MDHLRKNLEDQIGISGWPDLQPHLLRDALVVVSSEMNLLDVAVEVANDNIPQVETWMTEGKLSKPTLEQLKTWPETAVEFHCVILAPFVFIQERLKS